MVRQCQICSGDGKYKCPACFCVTCSLACVNAHKENTKCSGVRNRAKMVSKRNYTEAHFMSDFTLLEETGRAVDAADRTLNALSSGKGISGGLMNRITQEAAKRNIRLSFMPKGFARHSRNTSQVKSVSKSRVLASGLKGAHMIFWHIDVYFAGLSIGANQLVKVESCAEDYSIETIVRGALSSLQKRNKRRRTEVHSMEKNTAALYAECDTSNLAVYLQNEHVTSTIPAVHAKGFAANSDCDMHRYALLDQSITLLQSLKGRAIIEFPVMYIAVRGSAAAERLSKTTFGLFEKPEPDAVSDSSASSDSSDEESVVDPTEKEKNSNNLDNTANGKNVNDEVPAITLQPAKSTKESEVTSQHIKQEETSKAVPDFESPLSTKTEEKTMPGTLQETKSEISEEKIQETTKNSIQQSPEDGMARDQSAENGISGTDDGNREEKKGSAERRTEGRKFSRFSSTAEKNPVDGEAKVQKPAAPEMDHLDSVPGPDFDHATHPTGLFDLPLPEGRVPRKPLHQKLP